MINDDGTDTWKLFVNEKEIEGGRGNNVVYMRVSELE